MYRLIKSERLSIETSDVLSSYRQVQVYQLQQLEAALRAFDICNDKSGSRHYILNEAGNEYYEGLWIE